ncbi:MAG TPA: threonine/serine dehydratase [Cyclobacteriaceae bacterium]|nr:threonine/serine dehydratase [Cyclobacteriaceae bacterium]
MKRLADRIKEAEKSIRPYVRETPLEYSYSLSADAGCEVYLKLENLQITGSFKARGSMNKILSLKDDKRKIITASTGNHGLGVANALKVTRKEGTIFLPTKASVAKVEAIKQRGIAVEFHGDSGEITETYARQLANDRNQVYVSPYNDEDVIAGQGTIGVELYRQLPELDAVFVSIGGGGLIAGIAAYLKSVNPTIQIIGCLPTNAPVMYESIKAGKIIDVPELPTLSDGTAGGIDHDTITFDLCRDLIDDYVLTTEEEILSAMRFVLKHHHHVIEGSAGVSVAAILKQKEKFKGKKVAAVICGSNVSEAVLKRVVCDV